MGNINTLRYRGGREFGANTEGSTEGPRGASQILLDDSTILWDVSKGSNASVTLNSDVPSRSIAAPFGIADREKYSLTIRQDAKGGATATFDSSFVFPTSPVITTDANSAVMFRFEARKVNTMIVLYCNYQGPA